MAKGNQGSCGHGQSDVFGVQGAEANFRDRLALPDERYVGDGDDASESAPSAIRIILVFPSMKPAKVGVDVGK